MARDQVMRLGRRRFLQGSTALVGLGLLEGCGTVSLPGQQSARVPQIGYLAANFPTTNPARIEALRQGLRDLGYVEGENIAIEWRFAEGKLDRLSEFATELVRLKVDIIVTGGSPNNRPAKEATATIPIVMGFDNDPVGNGYVGSLARPGTNMTGLATLAPEISGKHIEILKGIVPKLSHVAVFGTSTQPGNAQSLEETELAAGAVGVTLQYLDVRSPTDIEAAFRVASEGGADAVLALQSAVLSPQRIQIADLAVKSRLPTIFPQSEYVEDGGLLAYGVSVTDLFRRAATYVDKILKGAKPADLPVQQPTKFDFVINLKTAQAIGLTIPQSILQQATEIIQ